MVSVECKNVTIKYKTGDLKSIGLKEYVVKKISGKYHVTEFVADKDISFSINKGDMLGIIGTNGAGKSTLLKAVTGILKPESGTIKTKGTIAALLELASGFDNDMTVRENTYLRGALLGYTKDFMDEKYNEIIEFAGLEKFQDYAFKQLSSGMKSRLAFSIACLVDPDIIILDEVLSVGDGAFKKKSGQKMREILNKGITGILVSHSINQVRDLCNKIIWIDHGNQIAFSDDVDLLCDAYEEFLLNEELPSSQEEIEELAAAFREKKAEEEAKKRENVEHFREMVVSGDHDATVQAALAIIQKEMPKALRKDYRLS